jgi:hypothetical protein
VRGSGFIPHCRHRAARHSHDDALHSLQRGEPAARPQHERARSDC